MASNSGTSNVVSPEADKTEESITPSPASEYTVSFNTSSYDGIAMVSHGSVGSKTVKAGDYVVLPKGYAANYPGYYIDGWSTTPPTATPENDTRTGVKGKQGPINENRQYYAVWKKMPVSPLEPPPPPILLYVNANNPAGSGNKGPLDIKAAPSDDNMIEVYGPDYKGKGREWNDYGNGSRLGRFVNLTKNAKSKKDGGYSLWAQVRIWTNDTGSYEQVQHPGGNLPPRSAPPLEATNPRPPLGRPASAALGQIDRE